MVVLKLSETKSLAIHSSKIESIEFEIHDMNRCFIRTDSGDTVEVAMSAEDVLKELANEAQQYV